MKNRLAGVATCGVWGGGLIVETSSRKRGRKPEYVCHRRRKNGTCSNALRMAVDSMNEDVLRAVEEHALTPEAIEQMVQLTERDDVRDRQTALHRERQDVEKRIARLVDAIATGGDAPSLVAKVRELEMRRVAITRELRGLRPVPRLAPHVVENRLSAWRRLLRQSTTQGRAVLQRVVDGRITFVPSGEGYTFEARTRFDKLFSGVAYELPPWVDPEDNSGKEHLTPEDTLDGDYGRLLERVHDGKGLASSTGHPFMWKPPIRGTARRAA